jgi:hypothetical protein
MKPLKSLVVISWPHTKGCVIMLGWHGRMEMLVTWKEVMKSLLMRNVYNLYRMKNYHDSRAHSYEWHGSSHD